MSSRARSALVQSSNSPTPTLVDGVPGKRRNVRRKVVDGREEVLDIVEDRRARRVGRHGVAVLAAKDPVRVAGGNKDGAGELRGGGNEAGKGEEDALRREGSVSAGVARFGRMASSPE